MEALLKESGWSPIRSNSGTAFDTLQQQVNNYKYIEDQPAWKDFLFRLSQLRESTRVAIERGGVDKFGRRHDDEQRAVLFMLDNLLSYVPSLREQFDYIVQSQEATNSLVAGPIHGEDRLANLTTDF